MAAKWLVVAQETEGDGMGRWGKNVAAFNKTVSTMNGVTSLPSQFDSEICHPV